MTTGGFSARQLFDQRSVLQLLLLTNTDTLEVGEVATSLGKQKQLPIYAQVRIDD